MDFNFSQVERALMAMHDVPESSRAAFLARLKHLQRLGFPPGINTGRGRAATYHVEHAFLLALVLEMIQLGQNPERATIAIYRSIADISKAALMYCEQGQDGLEPIYLVLVPAILSEALEVKSPGLFLRPETLTGLRGYLESSDGIVRRLSVINIKMMIWSLFKQLDPSGSDAALLDELMVWAKGTSQDGQVYSDARLRRFHRAHLAIERGSDGNS